MNEKTCKSCGYAPVKPVLTPAQFQKRFKVGDKVTAWSTDKPVILTAIGKERVLFTDYRGNERAGTQKMRWREL